MTLVEGPAGLPLEVRVTGSGAPVTVFAHGLAESIDETRPFGSGVGGSRVFLHFRGHGASLGPDEPWTYTGLEAELLSVVRRFGATRALGVSLGAGAALRAAWEDPLLFEKLVIVLPGMIDRQRHDAAIQRMADMSDLVERRDVEALAAALRDQQPLGARTRPDVLVWATRRARRLIDTTVARGLRELPLQHPLPEGADLSAVDLPVLVIGQEGDPTHPADVARELAGRLPNSSLTVFDKSGLVWNHRAELRSLIAAFLNSR